MNKIYFLLSILLVLSCSKNQNTNVKPNPSGKSGEIIVIISDNLWQTNIGDTIFYSLTEPFGVLPQDESIFNIVHIPKSAFKSIFKTHRNIIIIDINSKNTEATVKKQKNKWAKLQLIYTFSAPNKEEFFKLWNNYNQQVKDHFFNAELNRYKQAFSAKINKDATTKIANKYNISLKIPSDYHLDVEKDNFAWISRETDISTQAILIYDYPYTDSNTFTVDYLINKRDEITKTYVLGPEKNTYMQTEKRVPFVVEEINLNGEYAFVIRGLWHTKNYFMGGPFVSITTLDKDRNRIVTVETFVYAGKQRKKLYLWQVESIIKTLKILN